MLILSRTRRIDWPRLVDNLRRLGMSVQEIADAIGVRRQAVDYWAGPESDGEPAFWTGSALLVLWCERTGLHWTDAPVRTVSLSVSASMRA